MTFLGSERLILLTKKMRRRSAREICHLTFVRGGLGFIAYYRSDTCPGSSKKRKQGLKPLLSL